jgi:hypothetical protein
MERSATTSTPKQELLVEAVLNAFGQAIPMTEFQAVETTDDPIGLIGLIAAQPGESSAIDPKLTGLMMEAS